VVYSAAIPSTGAVVSESPFVRDLEVIAMLEDWDTMGAVTRGTNYLRDLHETFLPQEPREDDDAYQTRIDRSVLSPYTSRLIETAAGAILRKPIQIEGDDYWLELSENIDGLGSNINEYARRALVSSLTYGHSAVLVDYPAASDALNLAEERALGRRPYFIHIDAPQIWGWRQASTMPGSALTQVRIHEYTTRPLNEFGEEQIEQMRVIYPGRYDLYTLGQDVVEFSETGDYSLEEIPLVPIYSNRRGMLRSLPPLLDIANLNITHYQRQADLIHALHIAAMPTLVLEGWDDTTGSASMGVNYAISMNPGNKAYYVQADATSFDAQMAELQALEAQMSTLGVTKLFGQKFVAESAEAKRIDQAQSNSVLSIISQELESALNQAFDFAARYVGIEAPTVRVDRDFEYYRLIGQDVSVIAQLNQMGKLSDQTMLEILRRGEILPDNTKIEDELERLPGIELQQQLNTDLN
jgi:hypothetical protein|tara:strand:+ start:568 stop:1971 length:1404 start_codon:yes stop_codon:yes gene_type:complete